MAVKIVVDYERARRLSGDTYVGNRELGVFVGITTKGLVRLAVCVDGDCYAVPLTPTQARRIAVGLLKAASITEDRELARALAKVLKARGRPRADRGKRARAPEPEEAGEGGEEAEEEIEFA